MERHERHVHPREPGDGGEHCVPERERVARVETAVLELVRDRDGAQRVRLGNLAGAREMEEHVPGPELDGGPPDEACDDRAHAEHADEHEAFAPLEGNRARERNGERRDDGDESNESDRHPE